MPRQCPGVPLSTHTQPATCDGSPPSQPLRLRSAAAVAHTRCPARHVPRVGGAAIDGKLDQCRSDWDDRASVGIVLAAGGYPGSYNKGDAISGLPETEVDGEKVFHAGTKLDGDQVVTAGGRVLCATALGNSVTEAQQRAYELAAKIQWDGAFYRKDIAFRAIAREQG